MSLESEIKALTAAINRWCDTMTAPTHAPAKQSAVLTDNYKDFLELCSDEELLTELRGRGSLPTTVAKQEVAAQAKPLAQTATPAELAKGYGASPAQVASAAEAAPTFDDAKRAFLAIAQKYGAVEGTAKSKEVLSRYGVPNLKALGAEQYPDFIALCGTVVEGGEA